MTAGSDQAAQGGALSGIRVLDLSRILAGPTCTQILGDLGADVIKVEKPDEGDDTRRWGPPYVTGKDGQPSTESAYFLAANRNKRSIAVDLTTASGQRAVRMLLNSSDVLIENFKTGALARFGLDYETLSASFPRLVYCSITGFGQTGPYASRAGYDFLAQAMGGIMSITGEPKGDPMKVGVGITDITTGLYATIGILAALQERARTGRGQRIDIALLDTQVSWLANEATNYLLSGNVPARRGNEHPNIAPYKVYGTADGHAVLCIGNDGQFLRWCAAAGVDALALDARFATNPARLAHRADLDAAVSNAMARRTTREWLSILEPLGVPIGPVNTIDEVFEDPQVISRNMRLSMPYPHAATGSVDLVGSPLKLSRTPVSYRRTPPRLGEHTDEIVREFGLSSHSNTEIEIRKQP
jgi:crotonobetainyl-CoA:carnitine CoA-transferase CaiB-like acyl-CoA transferase